MVHPEVYVTPLFVILAISPIPNGPRNLMFKWTLETARNIESEYQLVPNNVMTPIITGFCTNGPQSIQMQGEWPL